MFSDLTISIYKTVHSYIIFPCLNLEVLNKIPYGYNLDMDIVQQLYPINLEIKAKHCEIVIPSWI